MAPQPNLARLRAFVEAFAQLLGRAPTEPVILGAGAELIGELVAIDDWLPDEYATPDPERYQQYLLHADSASRFSVVSFVWGPGQSTPIHDHTVWGLLGILRGGESVVRFQSGPGGLEPSGPPMRYDPGDVDAVSPSIGDIHQVSNAYEDRVSVSIHVYGADIGAVKRSTYAPTGERKPFVSGYANTRLPNFWGRQK